VRNLLLFFGAGAFGALVNSLTVWLFGLYGLNQAVGVAIAPSLTPYWLYPRLLWGALWGWLFLLPWIRGSIYCRGLVLSLVPTLVQLFIIFPYHSYHGIAGMELGALTPLMVLFFNGVWGLATAVAIKLS